MAAEDYDSIRSAQQNLEDRACDRARCTTKMMAGRRLVGIIEGGYSMTVDDYTNDIAFPK